MYDYGWRQYMPDLGRWMQLDPLVEDTEDPYAYVFNNPISLFDPDGRAPDDIRILGANNSSVTVKTNLVDITINASSLGVDFGGKYTVGGDDVVEAALDIGGVVDQSGIIDGIAAGYYGKKGDWTNAIISGVSILPAGDVAKLGKLEKHIKTIEKAVDAVNANSKASEKAQTIYGLAKKGSDKIEKVGISSGKLDKNGIPYRANKQVNKLGKDKYEARVLDKQPAGKNARAKGLELEKKHTNANKSTINPNIHKRPKPE